MEEKRKKRPQRGQQQRSQGNAGARAASSGNNAMLIATASLIEVLSMCVLVWVWGFRFGVWVFGGSRDFT